MPYYYRVFIDLKKADGSTDWIEFDSALISHNLITKKTKKGRTRTYLGEKEGPADRAIDDIKIARRELLTISKHKRFRVETGPNDIDVHTLHALFAMEQQGWTRDTVIDFVRYDEKAGKKAGVVVVDLRFAAQITSHVVVDLDYWDFNFKIVGGSELDDDEP